ncbi:uncharacterized protein LOC129607943 [Condylostylus longicornis]|uniref:uncharacterized protein LOC129607943 n=1 Tax=Condylostylus longicornis TaxID=2530218 RepID=UPI00244DA5C2|nr:uncharacterized protein LOC129607943 [Condylostylus longicornis]
MSRRNIKVQAANLIKDALPDFEFLNTELDNTSNLDQFQTLSNDTKILKEILEIVKELKEENEQINQFNKNLHEQNKKLYIRFAQELVGLKNEIADLKMLLPNRVNMSSNRPKIVSKKLPQFPLTTLEKILDFEKSLKKDKEMQIELIDRFSRANNENLTQFIKENLKIIFGNDEVASKFSWKSSKDNISVEKFTIVDNLREACITYVYAAKENRIHEDVRHFFSTIKDRVRKRKSSNKPPTTIKTAKLDHDSDGSDSNGFAC